MANFILIFFCLGAGFIAARTSALPRGSHKSVNVWVVYFGLPAIVVRYLPGIDWNLKLLVPAISPLLCWVGAWLFVKICSRLKTLDRETQAVLLVACGLSNTGFFGFPMIIAFYGVEALRNAIVYDIATIITFCTLGVATVLKAASRDDGGANFKVLAKKIFTFPVFSTALMAFTLSRFLDLSVLYPFVDLVVPTVAPLALFSIGLQFDFKDMGSSISYIGAGLLYKLLLAPALILLFALIFGATGDIGRTSVFLAGCPSHVLVCLTASQFNLNPRLCGLMVALTIIGALISMPLWHLAMKLIF